MDMLLLTTPAQHAAANPAVEKNPKRLKRWIADLPRANVIETVRSLRQAIEPFNEVQLPDTDRYRLLEVYHEGLDDILFFYDDLRLSTLPISSVEKKALSQDILWLYLELAKGYKAIVKNGFDAGHDPRRDTTLLAATFRAMQLIVHALIYTYRVHEGAPPLAYLEIHQLYEFARHYDVLTMKIKSLKGQDAQPNIDTLYKQFMLFSVCDPYHFETTHITELFLLLSAFASLCTIEDARDEIDNSTVFAINLMEDHPPSLVQEQAGDTLAEYQRCFNPGPALKVMRKRLDAKGSVGRSSFLEQENLIIRKLLDRFDSHQHCHDRHAAVEESASLFIGLLEVNRCLTRFDATLNSTPDASEASDNARTDELAPISCTILERSDQGRLLSLNPSEISSEIRIGDIVSLRETPTTDVETSAPVGVIRWTRGHPNGTLNLGIEFLSGEPIPVVCRSTAREQDNREPFAALYFPSSRAAGLPTSLLTEKSRYTPGLKLELRIRDKVFNVTAGALVAESTVFNQFSLRAVKD